MKITKNAQIVSATLGGFNEGYTMLTYYIRPKSIEEMTHHITGKILDEFGIECSGFQRWCE